MGCLFVCFNIPSNQGFDGAQWNLGGLYAKGRGVPQDLAKARTWWRRAARQGDANAQYNLGLHHAKGRGSAPRLVLAHMWLSLAAPQLPSTKRTNARKVLSAMQRR